MIGSAPKRTTSPPVKKDGANMASTWPLTTSAEAASVGRLRAWLPELTSMDVALALSGMLFGAQSLFYPFGRDQATHGYIGREWLAGRLPFVSTFDIKTPGIFFVHMATFAIFGEHPWGLRVVDLFGCCS